MKVKKMCLFLIFLVSILCVSSMCFATEKGVVTGATVRVREENNTDSNILFNLSKDSIVEIIEEKDNWYKIKYKNETGWISTDYVSTDNVSYTVKITKDTEILLLPTINAKASGNISSGNKVTINEEINGWYFIEKDNKKGWIRQEFLEIEEPEQEKQPVGTEPEPEKEPEKEKPKEEEKDNPKEKEEVKILRYVYVDTSSARIRKEANTSSEVVDTAIDGTKVAVIGEAGDWYKIQIVGKIGYIRKDLTRDTAQSTVSRSDSGRVPSSEETQKDDPKDDKKEETDTPTNNTTTNNNASDKPSSNNDTSSNASKPTPSGTTGSEIVAYAKKYIGCKYVYGGTSPSGFDCSGFVYYVYKNCAGITLNRSSSAQSSQGIKIKKSELQLGDLVFFSQDGSGKNVGHVGIYIGGNQMVHASTPSTGVIISSLSESYYVKNYVCSRRILGN